MDLLTNYNLIERNGEPDCFLDDVRWSKQMFFLICVLKMFRYSATDYVNGKIVEGTANSIEECQVKFYLTSTAVTMGTQFIVQNIFRIPALMRRSVNFSSISLRTITSQKSGDCAGCCGKVIRKLLIFNLVENKY